MIFIFLAIFTTTIAVDQSNIAHKATAQAQVVQEVNEQLIAQDSRLRAENRDLVNVVQSITPDNDKKVNKIPCRHVTPCLTNQK